MRKTILCIENDDREADAIGIVLASDFEIVHCAVIERALEYVAERKPAAVLVDIGHSRDREIDLIRHIAAGTASPPVIAMSEHAEPRTVIEAVRHGAADFLPKPLHLDELRRSLERAIVPPPTHPFVGASPACRTLAKNLRIYASHDYPVLIQGESGTGKEIAARGVHVHSARRDRPFIARNCAAFPDNLIESELFGSARGAFTGAVERPGAFELADGGTLFLDEIGEAGPGVQAKLLRVLETGDLWRLGDRRPRKVDVRLVSATARRLEDALAEGSFRQDLLYRINTLVLELPALRERREDIPELARQFVLAAAGPRKRLSEGALARLEGSDWPGNIRQLKNAVHRAIVLSGDLEEIGVEHIIP